jgi:hypothetical protein
MQIVAHARSAPVIVQLPRFERLTFLCPHVVLRQPADKFRRTMLACAGCAREVALALQDAIDARPQGAE